MAERLVKLYQELIELAGELYVIGASSTSSLVRSEICGVGLDDNPHDLLVGFFAGFGGEECFDLLQSGDGGVKLGLFGCESGAVEEEGLVVRRVDVAKDAAGCCEAASFDTADGDDEGTAVAVLVFAALNSAAQLTWAQHEWASRIVGFDGVEVMFLVPSLRWGVKTHLNR